MTLNLTKRDKLSSPVEPSVSPASSPVPRVVDDDGCTSDKSDSESDRGCKNSNTSSDKECVSMPSVFDRQKLSPESNIPPAHTRLSETNGPLVSPPRRSFFITDILSESHRDRTQSFSAFRPLRVPSRYLSSHGSLHSDVINKHNFVNFESLSKNGPADDYRNDTIDDKDHDEDDSDDASTDNLEGIS